MAITIQGPDGASIDFPEGTSEAEMSAAMAQAYPHSSDTAQPAVSTAPGVMAGVSRALETNLPFVDRAVAAAKSSLPQGYGGTGQDYAANLAAEKAKNAQFAEQNPWTNAVGGLAAYAPAALLPGGSGLYGRIGTGALTGFGLGGLQGASNSPDLTNTEETGRDIAQGELTGGAFGAFVPAAAHGIGQGYSALADSLRGPKPSEFLPPRPGLPMAPAGAQLATDVKGAYKNVEDMGAAYSPASIKSMTDKIAADAADEDIDPGLNPKATTVIKGLQDRAAAKAESGAPITLPELDKWRQYAADNLSGSPEPKQARFGALIRNNIDDFVNTAFPGDMVPMPGAKPSASAPSEQGAIPAGEHIVDANRDKGPLSGAGLVVANKMSDGSVVYGEPGQLHYAIHNLSLEGPQVVEHGFAQPGGPFMSRQEASNFIKQPSGQAAQVPSGPAPTPMLDFLRRAGGVQDEGGDLASMGFADLNGRAGKGSFKIIDKENGLPMDEGRRMAVEQGYMEPHETVSDFINKLGEHPTYSVHNEEAVAARAARSAEPGAEFGNNPAGIAPEDYSGLGEAPPAAARPVIPANAAAPSGPVASAQEAAAAIRNARGLAQRQFKARALAEALENARTNADVSGTGGNIENTGRRSLASIMDEAAWSPDEAAQLEKMIHGTALTNTTRQLSRFGPKGNALVALAELLAIGSGNPLAMTAGGVGMGAQVASAIARRNAQGQMIKTILAGGQAPTKAVAPSSKVSRAAMAAALAANADLQAQRNQATPQ